MRTCVSLEELDATYGGKHFNRRYRIHFTTFEPQRFKNKSSNTVFRPRTNT